MKTLMRKLEARLRGERLDAELDEEIRLHLEMATEAYMGEGMTRRNAEAAARRDFGSIQRARERHRDARRIGWLDNLRRDLRFGTRSLARRPGMALTVVLALSLGIGLSAITFSLIDGAVLTTLPVDGGDRIVRIDRQDRLAATADDYVTWSTRQRSLEAIGAVRRATVSVTVDGWASEPVRSAAITPTVLDVLSVQPTLGRAFSDQDAIPGATPVVLISHRLWLERMDADPNVLGQTVRVNGRPAEVVGVMPEGFGFPFDERVWSPLSMEPGVVGAGASTESQESDWIVGRLREGVSMAAAAGELTSLTEDLDRQNGRDGGAASAVKVVGFTDLFSEPGRSPLLAGLMLGVALMVLLVACANATNVLLAAAIARRREMAIRRSMGAARRRIIAQLLAEISLLAGAGAVGGALIALLATRFIASAVPEGMPYWVAFRIDWAALGFIAFVAALSALLAGVLPALQASGANANGLLKDGARGSSGVRVGRIMRRLIGVEIAFSVLLLVLAGLFVRSAANFSATEFAFQPDGVYTSAVGFPDHLNDEARAMLAEELHQALRAIPEVAQVALTNAVPGVGSSGITALEVDGLDGAAPAEGGRARSIVVTPGYFDLFRTPLLAGRNFDARDRADALPVAIVNEAFARRHLPEGALDRRFRFTTAEGEEWRSIIGVTPDLMAGGVQGEQPEAVYLPLAQNPQSMLRIVARPQGDFASVATPIRESVAAVDPDIALFRARPLDQIIAEANSQYTWFSLLFLISGGIALFLAAVGLYGVMAFWVVQRTREIGVRMALGGRRGDIVRMVLRQGMRQTYIGLLAGLVLAIPAGRLLRSGLFGVEPYDPLVFGSILAVLLGAAFLGCWWPAHRATRIDPIRALGAE